MRLRVTAEDKDKEYEKWGDRRRGQKVCYEVLPREREERGQRVKQ